MTPMLGGLRSEFLWK